MKKNYFSLFLGSLVSIGILLASCRRINESTVLGGDLIPAVDNVTTFDTTITVEAYNDIFPAASDSFLFLRGNQHFLGMIDNANKDPLFGTTDARLFLQLKPSFYKYSFATDTLSNLFLDSVVLVLDYVDTYGDTNVAQQVKVFEIAQGSGFKADSSYKIVANSFTYTNEIGSRTFTPSVLNDSVKAYRDTTKNQLRIRLNTDFGRRLLDYDSTTGLFGAYSSDSAFNTKFKGFALQSFSGKAVMAFNLTGVNTKLAIYYNYIRNSKRDTTVTYFNFTSTSASANYIQRDRTGADILAQQGGTAPDPLVFLQNSPGSFATIKIPDLKLVSNRLIHRAELICEEVYHPSDTIFTEPGFLYLDAWDTAISKFKTIPFDINFSQGGININSFGMAPLNQLDASGRNIKVWKMNITRYVQNYLTRILPLHDLRLYSPFVVSNKLTLSPSSTTDLNPFILNPTIVKGRVRLAGGTPGPQRMRLRLVYSKL